MWRPATWKDFEALIGEAETPSLDFKRALGKNEELAKDIAAMSVNGGVLAYGVDEDKETCVASSLMPFPLAGVEEKIRLIAGSRIAPTPDFDIEVVPNPEDDALCLVAVAVPASSLAPHQANARYPCRRGTTTDYLEEREVERLYRQRQELSGPAPEPGSLLEEDFASALDGFQVGDGTGQLLLVVRPAARNVSHPAGAWQGRALTDAVARARDRQGPRVANASLVNTFRVLSEWHPNGATGWIATNAANGTGNIAPQAAPQVLIGAALSYPASLSFQAFFGLRVGGDQSALREYRSAREGQVVYELVAMLAIAGEYFADVTGGGNLLAELRLRGFEEARSQFATEMRGSTADLEATNLPGASDGLLASARSSAIELGAAPEQVARWLIERWLPSFYTDDRDLFDVIVPPKP